MGSTWDDVRRCLGARAASASTGGGSDRRAAVALILRDGAAGIELLFIRRAEHPMDPWSGQMAFPGGRAEPGDRDLEATAVRETLEEIGLDLGDAERLGALDEVRAMARLRPMNLTILPVVFRAPAHADLRLSEEVTSVHWLPLAPLLGAELRSTMDYVHEGSSLQFPCVRVADDLVIWGLTYRMLLALGDLLAGSAADARP